MANTEALSQNHLTGLKSLFKLKFEFRYYKEIQRMYQDHLFCRKEP